MSPPAADPLLARLERGALAFTALAAAVSVGVRGGRFDVAWGILGGGLLTFISYWAIRSGIDALVGLISRTGGAASEPAPARLPLRARPVVAALRFAGRYALLGFLAYVMIARLRLHPVGLLIGVSSMVAAALVEAVRQLSGADRPRGPRGRPSAS